MQREEQGPVAEIPSISDQNFEEKVLAAEKPVLVDFGAEWCGPCKALAPMVEQLAKDYRDVLDVYTLDIGENPQAPARFGVLSVPTLLLFHQGEVVGRLVGSVSKAQIEKMIDSLAADR